MPQPFPDSQGPSQFTRVLTRLSQKTSLPRLIIYIEPNNLGILEYLKKYVREGLIRITQTEHLRWIQAEDLGSWDITFERGKSLKPILEIWIDLSDLNHPMLEELAEVLNTQAVLFEVG